MLLTVTCSPVTEITILVLLLWHSTFCSNVQHSSCELTYLPWYNFGVLGSISMQVAKQSVCKSGNSDINLIELWEKQGHLDWPYAMIKAIKSTGQHWSRDYNTRLVSSTSFSADKTFIHGKAIHPWNKIFKRYLTGGYSITPPSSCHMWTFFDRFFFNTHFLIPIQ